MPNIRSIAVAGGGGFTSVRASMPAHLVLIRQDDADATKKALTVKYFYDNFTASFQYAPSPATGPATVIKLVGPGAQGILRRPQDYSAKGAPATAEEYVQIKASDGSAINLIVEEYEKQETSQP